MSDKTEGVDKKLSKQMFSLIELLTTSGKPTLNPEIMKKFKKICRTSDVYVTHAHELLMMQLTKNHSEIRLSTFQMIDELFNRSHAFRLLILQDFQTLMELTVGTDRSLPIPPPKAAAKTMKVETCKSIQQWYDKFKEGYPKLVLGYEFLTTNKKVDFDEIHAQVEQERQMKEESERKLDQARKDKLEKVDREMQDGVADIELVVTEVENGLKLLMPHPDNFFIGTSESTSTLQTDSTETSPVISKSETPQMEETLGDTYDLQKDADSVKQKENFNNVLEPKGAGLDQSITKPDNTKVQQSGSHNSGENESKNMDSLADISCIKTTQSTCNVSNGALKKNLKQTCLNDDMKTGQMFGPDDSNNDGKSNDDEEEEAEDNDSDEEDYGEDMRGGVFTQEHGILSHTFEITVDMGAEERGLKVTYDNADIVQDVREKYKLIKSKYLNYVKRWIQVMTDCHAKTDDIRRMEALKTRLEGAVRKCLELDIISSSTSKSTEDSDSEDDFEDVPEKEGYEDDIPEHIKLEAVAKACTSQKGKRKAKGKQKKQYWMLPDDDDDDNAASDPTTIQSNLKKIAEKSINSGKATVVPKLEPGTSGEAASPQKSNVKQKKIVTGKSKEALLEQAPVKPFGVDLEHWENPGNIEAPLQVKYEGASRFWVPDKDVEESASQEQVAALTMRTVTFTGEFEPVKWKCRAPLSDGRLCERMDRKKCPFHGKIIPRDEIGQPTDPADIERIMKEDIEQANGGNQSTSSTKGKSPVNGKGKGKAKKRKYPNLTDITETKNSRQRLEAKIFKRSTLKRVHQCLDAADLKKVTDKFSNQFNYSLH